MHAQMRQGNYLLIMKATLCSYVPMQQADMSALITSHVSLHSFPYKQIGGIWVCNVIHVF